MFEKVFEICRRVSMKTKRKRRISLRNIDSGVSSLHQAIREGHVKLVKILVRGGVDVNSLCDDKTAIMAACYSWAEYYTCRPGILQISRYLISQGADPYKTNSKGVNSFDVMKGLNIYFLNVELSICVQQKTFSGCNSQNVTGNIYFQHASSATPPLPKKGKKKLRKVRSAQF